MFKIPDFKTNARVQDRPRDRWSAATRPVAMLSVFSLVVTVVFVALSGTLGTTASADGSLVTYGEPTVSVSSDDWPAVTQGLIQVVTSLVDENKSEFLGSYVNDDNDVVLVPASSLGVSLATQLGALPGLIVESANVSISQAYDLGEQIRELSPTLAESVIMWGGYPQNRGIFLTVPSMPAEAERQSIEDFASSQSLPIYVEVVDGLTPLELADSRVVDASPYSGGARYASANGASSSATLKQACSMGFSYKVGSTDYVLTAGHCFPTNSDNDWMWIYSGSNSSPSKYQYAGKVCCSTFKTGTGTITNGLDSGYHGDLALVNVTAASRSASPNIWWGAASTTTKIPVTSRTAPAVGNPVCANGAVSGSDCGLKVWKTNTSGTTASGETFRDIDAATSSSQADCPVQGDSGGSIVYDHSGAETAARGIGIVSAYSLGSGATSCVMTFTGAEEAVQAWGGNVKFQ